MYSSGPGGVAVSQNGEFDKEHSDERRAGVLFERLFGESELSAFFAVHDFHQVLDFFRLKFWEQITDTFCSTEGACNTNDFSE